MKIALLDIGGTEIKAALLDWPQSSPCGGSGTSPHAEREAAPQRPRLEARPSVLTLAYEGGPAVLGRAAEMLRGMGDFDCIGISTAGQVDHERGVIRYANPNIPAYTGCDLRGYFGGLFDCLVSVENDVNAAALGELHFGVGAGAGPDSFLCLTLGTGIGGAIVENGELLRGVYGCAGEFGAMVTHAEARKAGADEMAGCFERYASTAALVRQAAALDPALQSGRALFAQFERPEVKALVDAWLKELAIGLGSLVHLLNPGAIVLGGGVMQQPYLLPALEKELQREVFPSFWPVLLKRAELGGDAGLWGAAYGALRLSGRWQN